MDTNNQPVEIIEDLNNRRVETKIQASKRSKLLRFLRSSHNMYVKTMKSWVKATTSSENNEFQQSITKGKMF